jgi:hypothetical protein
MLLNVTFQRIPNSVNGSFTDLGYHKRPTFFGCNDFKAPLIIYLPNYYAVGETNQPTSQTTYTVSIVLYDTYKSFHPFQNKLRDGKN